MNQSVPNGSQNDSTIEPDGAQRAVLVDEHRGLEGELDGRPQQVEIDEVHDLAVEIGAPVAVDDLGQEQAGNQKEVRHPERLGEGDDLAQPALLAERVLDARASNASSPRR